VTAAAYYRQLVQLGRDEFLATAAPAAFVRFRGPNDDLAASAIEDETVEDTTMPVMREPLEPGETDLEVYPLAKKPGASFPDRITIGRTANNDIVIADHSISRLHAYVRKAGDGWVVADAGSKNGSVLRGENLEARKEKPIASRAILRLGDVELTFYAAADLFAALGGP
jgi:pSer/pThr/pTyr-binding forkhead associated (FHA) protein